MHVWSFCGLWHDLEYLLDYGYLLVGYFWRDGQARWTQLPQLADLRFQYLLTQTHRFERTNRHHAACSKGVLLRFAEDGEEQDQG